MKNNFIANYFVSSWHELKKVSWPTKEAVLNHTLVVLSAAILAIVITGILDYGLTFLVQLIVENKQI